MGNKKKDDICDKNIFRYILTTKKKSNIIKSEAQNRETNEH